MSNICALHALENDLLSLKYLLCTLGSNLSEHTDVGVRWGLSRCGRPVWVYGVGLRTYLPAPAESAHAA